MRRLRAWRAAGRMISPFHVVLAASLEVRVAIFYATLINIVAVIPVMLVGGLTGAFFEPLALAYGLAVLASMVVALTVTPALGYILLRDARLKEAEPPVVRVAQARVLAGAVAGAARPGVRVRRGRHRALVGGFAYPHLGEDLFPTFKEPDFLMHFVTKPGTSVHEQDRMVASLQDQVLKVPGVSTAGSHVGQALLGEEVSGVNFSETWLSLKPGTNYDATVNKLQEHRRLLPRRVQRRADLPARADRRGAHQRHHRGRRRLHRGPGHQHPRHPRQRAVGADGEAARP